MFPCLCALVEGSAIPLEIGSSMCHIQYFTLSHQSAKLSSGHFHLSHNPLRLCNQTARVTHMPVPSYAAPAHELSLLSPLSYFFLVKLTHLWLPVICHLKMKIIDL